MKLEQLQRRIARAEALLEGRERQVVFQWGAIRRIWRSAWTPGRIVVAGLGLGFASGLAAPKQALSGIAGKLSAAPELLQLIGAVSALFAAIPEFAEEVATSAGNAGGTAAHPRPDTAPAPAEAATDLSER